MAAALEQAVRLAVTGDLTAWDRKALVSLLCRSGVSWRLVPFADAEVIVCYGEPDCSPFEDRVCVHIPRSRLERGSASWREEYGKFLNAFDEDGLFSFVRIRRRESKVRLKFDLAGVVAGVLAGWDEEPTSLDEHDRFHPRDYSEKRASLLSFPIADIAARGLGESIYAMLGRPLPPPVWTVSASFDVDSPGMFHGLNLVRNARLVLRYHRENLIKAFSEGARSKMGLLVDPHVRLRTLGEALEGLGIPATFLVQTHRLHKLDNYHIGRSRALRRQVDAIMANEYHEVGLHSSYATRYGNVKTFLRQWKRLHHSFGKGISNVHRAHYLRTPEAMNYPAPRQGEMMVDSSLGFGQLPGFRRGTAYPFIANETVLELAPTVMDSTYIFWLRYTPSRTHEEVLKLMERVRRTGGAFVMVWHPHLMEDILFRGRLDSFYDIIYEAKRRGAQFRSLADAARSLHAEQVRLEQAIQGISS